MLECMSTLSLSNILRSLRIPFVICRFRVKAEPPATAERVPSSFARDHPNSIFNASCTSTTSTNDASATMAADSSSSRLVEIPPTCSLLEVPPELRLNIYNHLMSDDTDVAVCIDDNTFYVSREMSPRPDFIALLRTCKLINKEFHDTLWAALRFDVYPTVDWWAEVSDPYYRRLEDSNLLLQMRQVYLDFDGDIGRRADDEDRCHDLYEQVRACMQSVSGTLAQSKVLKSITVDLDHGLFDYCNDSLFGDYHPDVKREKDCIDQSVRELQQSLVTLHRGGTKVVLSGYDKTKHKPLIAELGELRKVEHKTRTRGGLPELAMVD